MCPGSGAQVVAEKRDRLYDTVDNFLAEFPGTKTPHPDLGLVIYPVTDTPFIGLYDYDEHELRVHFILARGAGDRLDDLDPTSADW